MLKTTIIQNYAYDYRDKAMSEEELAIMLTMMVVEIEATQKKLDEVDNAFFARKARLDELMIEEKDIMQDDDDREYIIVNQEVGSSAEGDYAVISKKTYLDEIL